MALPAELSMEAVGGLMMRPGFARAVRTLYRGKIDTVAEDPVMASLFRDAGHYVVTLLAFLLAHDEEGITLARLKAVCAGSRLMSPGRVRALLGYLEHVGFVDQVTARTGNQAAVYRPAPRFVDAWCRHMRSGLEAAAIIDEGAQAVLARMDEPGLAVSFARVQGGIISAAIFGQDWGDDMPFVRIFQHRLGGGRAMTGLIAAEDDDGDLAGQAVPFSLTQVAEMSGISRVQARRLFEDAQGAGLVVIEDGRLRWAPQTQGLIAFNAGFELAALLAAAQKTVKAVAA